MIVKPLQALSIIGKDKPNILGKQKRKEVYTMKNRFDEAIRFKNGNINIRFYKETIDDIKANKFSDIDCLSFALEKVDCYFVGKEFCISNYDMGILIYSVYSDKAFILAFSELEKLIAGKTLKLYAHNPDNEEREQIQYYLG